MAGQCDFEDISDLDPFFVEEDQDEDDFDLETEEGGKGQIMPKSKRNAYLKDWLLDPKHFAYPYPSSEEKKVLCSTTGLTSKQLKDWFTNARRRTWKPILNKILESVDLISILNEARKGPSSKKRKTSPAAKLDPKTSKKPKAEPEPFVVKQEPSSEAPSLPETSECVQIEVKKEVEEVLVTPPTQNRVITAEDLKMDFMKSKRDTAMSFSGLKMKGFRSGGSSILFPSATPKKESGFPSMASLRSLDTSALPKPNFGVSALPKPPNFDPSALPKPKFDTSALPKPKFDTSALPKPKFDNAALPKPKFDTSALPKPKFDTSALPKPKFDTSALPKPKFDTSALPKPNLVDAGMPNVQQHEPQYNSQAPATGGTMPPMDTIQQIHELEDPMLVFLNESTLFGC